MATSSIVPVSTPSTVAVQKPTGVSSVGSSNATPTQNPYVPVSTSSVAAPTPTWDGSEATNVAPIVPGGVASNNLQTQLVDIYGQGVGASLFNLLNNMSGTDSTALKEYQQSLVPQEAAASANIGASLGASGVSANSSVNAIAQANLQAQDTAMVAGESAKLQLSQEELEAQLLMGAAPAASKEVASSGWDIFGTVMNNITGDIGNLLGGSYNANDKSQATSNGSFASPFGDNNGAVPLATINDSAETTSTADLSAVYF